MTRRFLDDSLRHWEAFPSTGWQGVPKPALLVFDCLSDDREPPRAMELDGTRAEVETRLSAMSDAELRELVETAPPIR